MEAEVDNDDEDLDEEDDDDVQETFIAADDPAFETADSRRRILEGHHLLDRQKEAHIERDAAQIASEIKQRYRSHRATARYMGDADNVPQRLLMPDINGPQLWQVRVKVSLLYTCNSGYYSHREIARKRARHRLQLNAQIPRRRIFSKPHQYLLCFLP